MTDHAYDKFIETVTDIHKRHPHIKAISVPPFYYAAYQRNKDRFKLDLYIWCNVLDEYRVIPNNTLIWQQ